MPLFGPPNIDRLLSRGKIKRLVKALAYRRSADIRRRAIIALGELGDLGNVPMPEAIDALIDKLQAKEYRRECAVALGLIGDVRAVDALLVTLNNVDPLIRAAAATSLGQIGDGRAIQPLIDRLIDDDETVREAIMDALKALGAETEDMLTMALHDDDAALRHGAVQALESREWEPGQNTASAEYWILKAQWDQVADVGKPAVEPLLQILDEPATAASVAETLGKIGDARAVAPLAALISEADDDDKTRLAATEALAQIHSVEALPTLLSSLDDAMPEVRAAACRAMGHYPADQVASYLIGMCHDEAHEVRIAAAEVLKTAGQPTAAPVLVRMLGDAHVHARSLAQEGLIGMPETSRGDILPLLTTALAEGDRNIRDRAAKVLDAYGWEPTSDAAGAAYHITKRKWDDVAAIGAAAADPLVTALGESYLRQHALDLLPATGAAAVPALIEALEDENAEVRCAAAQSLGAIADERALGPLLDLLAWAEPEPPDAVNLTRTEENRLRRQAGLRQEARSAAADALGTLGAASVPALVTRLKAADADNAPRRELLAQALAGAGEPAIEPLIDILSDAALAPIAAQSLVDAGLPAVEPLVAVLSDPERSVAAAGALASLDVEPTQRLAEIAAEADDTDSRESLATVAAQIMDADRFALLARALWREPSESSSSIDSSLTSHEADERADALAKLADGADSAEVRACRLLAQADETADAAEALTLARRALLNVPTFSAAWVAAAELLRSKLDSPELAIGWVMQAMALLDEDAAIGSEGEGGEVDNPHAWVELGHCQAALGDPISASSVYAAATMIAPDIADPAPWLRLIEVYRQVGRVDEMYAAIERARDLGAQVPEDLDGGWSELVGAFDKQLITRMLDEVDAMTSETEEAVA